MFNISLRVVLGLALILALWLSLPGAPAHPSLAGAQADGTLSTAEPAPDAGAQDSLAPVEEWIRDNLADKAMDGEQDEPDPCPADQAEACSMLSQALGSAQAVFRQGAAAASFDDWSAYAAGQAVLPAGSLNPQRDKTLGQRSAVVQARKAMLELLLALPLDGSRTVGQALAGETTTLAAIRGLVQNSRLEDSCREAAFETGGEDGVCAALVSMSLLGALADQLIPVAEPFFSKLPPTVELDSTLVSGLARTGQVDLVYEQSLAELGGHTGVIIDARGLDVRAALLPRVVDLNGQAAYGSFQVSRAAAVQRGMAVYAVSPEDPRVAERVGASPLMVRAVGVAGTTGCDLLVCPSDADLIRKVFESKELSEAGSLVILR